MTEFVAANHNADDTLRRVSEAVFSIVQSGGEAKVNITRRSNGTLPLLRHWYALMGEIADIYRMNGAEMKFEAANGKVFSRPFNKDDAHELFTYYLMPIDPQSGKRKSWSRDGRDGMTPASTGERCQALEKLYAYAFERGWKLSRFADSEYEQLQQRQVA
ncbi:NinB/YbcN family protein [Photobacterium sp. R1]